MLLGTNNALPTSTPLVINDGTFNLAGYNQSVGAVAMAGGAVNGSGTLTGASFTVQSGTLSANLAGSSATFTSNGNGNVTLNGSNSFGGATTVAGTLVLDYTVNNASKLSPTANVLFESGQLSLLGNNTSSTSQSVAGIMLAQDDSTLTLSQGSAATLTLGAGSLSRLNNSTLYVQVASGTLGNGVAVHFTSPPVLSNTGSGLSQGILPYAVWYDSTDDAEFLTISGGSFLQLSNTSATLVSGENALLSTSASMSGSKSINSLAFAFNGNYIPTAVTGSGTLTVASGGILDNNEAQDESGNPVPDLISVPALTFGPNNSTSYEGIVHVTGPDGLAVLEISSAIQNNAGHAVSLTLSGGGDLYLLGNNTYTGTTNVLDGTLHVTSASLPGNAMNDATVTFEQSTNGTYSGSITGSGNVIKSGIGLLVLTGTSAYTGGTEVSGGTLRMGVANALPGTGPVIIDAGMALDLHNFNTNIGSLEGYGSLLLGSATLTVGGDGSSDVFFGTIGGSGSLVKTGSGSLILEGTSANTYTGTTIVSGGVLLLDKLDNTRAMAGPLLLSGGTAQWGAPEQLDGAAVTINSGEMDLAGNAETISTLSGSGGIVALGGAMLTVGTASAATTYSGTITGSGELTKIGSSKLILSGSDFYTGGTIVSAGTLILASRAALEGGTSLSIGASASSIFGDPLPQTAAVVPEPSTLLLLAVGGIVAAAAWQLRSNWRHRHVAR